MPIGVSYVGIISDKGELGFGTRILPDDNIIQGQIMDGNKLDGHGKMFYDPQKTSYYVGEWKNGKRQGKGTLIWTAYNYTGDWIENKMQGFGQMFLNKPKGHKGDTYTGQFKDNKKDGRGIFTCTEGHRYEGQYKNGERNGFGKDIRANGDEYDGIWKDGQRWTGTLNRKTRHCTVEYKDGSIVETAESLYCSSDQYNFR